MADTDSRYHNGTIPVSIARLAGNEIPEIVMNFRFVVMLNMKCFGFQSISGMSQTIDYEYVVEGGNNDFPRALRVPKKAPEQLTFKRGYIINKMGTTAILTGLGDSRKMRALERPNSVGTIFVLNRTGYLQAMYAFVTMGMTSWKLGDLDARSGQQLIETFTVMHRGITNVPIPWLDKSTIDQFKTTFSKGDANDKMSAITGGIDSIRKTMFG